MIVVEEDCCIFVTVAYNVKYKIFGPNGKYVLYNCDNVFYDFWYEFKAVLHLFVIGLVYHIFFLRWFTIMFRPLVIFGVIIYAV